MVAAGVEQKDSEMASISATRPAKSPWTRDRAAEREAKREAVLEAAAQAFAEAGYYRTSLDDIAVRLGISKPTLYYYAKNKEDLIAAVAARAAEQLEAPISADPNAPAIAELRGFLKRYAEIAATDFGRCFVLLNDSDLSPEGGARVRDGKGRIDRRIRELVARGVADGSIGRCDPKLTAFMLAGAINGISSWYKEGGALDVSTVSEIFINQMMAGLLPR
jgi:AcrR family transcriptional regulator